MNIKHPDDALLKAISVAQALVARQRDWEALHPQVHAELSKADKDAKDAKEATGGVFEDEPGDPSVDLAMRAIRETDKRLGPHPAPRWFHTPSIFVHALARLAEGSLPTANEEDRPTTQSLVALTEETI